MSERIVSVSSDLEFLLLPCLIGAGFLCFTRREMGTVCSSRKPVCSEWFRFSNLRSVVSDRPVRTFPKCNNDCMHLFFAQGKNVSVHVLVKRPIVFAAFLAFLLCLMSLLRAFPFFCLLYVSNTSFFFFLLSFSHCGVDLHVYACLSACLH